MNALQKQELEIAIFFKNLCEKHDLEYRLGGGTLLGSVRHKGFIPWDDDMDFEMPREDYEKLILILKENKVNHFVLRTWDEKDYPWCFAKIDNSKTTLILDALETYGVKGGVFIDIFPIDGTFSNLRLRKIHLKIVRILILLKQKAHGMPFLPQKKWKKFFFVLLFNSCITRKLFASNFFSKIIHFFLTLKKFNNSEFVGFLGWGLEKCIVKKEEFNSFIYSSFENQSFKITSDFNNYLQNLYGLDYMSLPPKQARKSHHGVVYLNFNMPYSNYKYPEKFPNGS